MGGYLNFRGAAIGKTSKTAVLPIFNSYGHVVRDFESEAKTR